MDLILEAERASNPLSKFYPAPSEPREQRQSEHQSLSRWFLERYSHEDALRFGVASDSWRDATSLPELVPQTEPITASTSQPSTSHPLSVDRNRIHAFYRIIGTRANGYSMQCCHVNVHAARKSLQYAVLDNRTKTVGMNGKSAVNALFIGDILEVTELALIQNSEHQPIWLAAQVSVLFRSIHPTVTTFTLTNNTAIIPGFTGRVDVSSDSPTDREKGYRGALFIPELIENHFTGDYKASSFNELIFYCATVKQAEPAKPTMFDLRERVEVVKALKIGRDAMKNNHNMIKEQVLETCVLLGTAATVPDAPYKKWFPVKNFQRKGDLIYFNVHRSFPLGVDRIELCCKESRYFAVIEGIQPHQSNGNLQQVTARLEGGSAPLGTETFSVSLVKPHKALDNLYPTFFTCLPNSSHAKKTITALYGGPRIFSAQQQRPQDQITFNLEDASFPLDFEQSRYGALIHEDVSIVVGTGPPGSGKSTTIMATVNDLWLKMDEWASVRNKQIVIAHDDISTAKLIEIGTYFSVSETELALRLIRYIPEDLWKDLERTDFDLPVVMMKEFQLWAYGYRERNKMTLEDKLNILNWLIKEAHITADDLKGEAAELYDRSVDSEVASKALMKAFFNLHDPVVIVINLKHFGSFLEQDLWMKNMLRAVHIDDAQLLPEHTLINLLTLFPHATFGLLGDTAQVEPGTLDAVNLNSKLVDYGIGNILKMAKDTRQFPYVEFPSSYRFGDEMTMLLHILFYQGKNCIPRARDPYEIIDGEEYFHLLQRPDLFPHPECPMLIFNNQVKAWSSQAQNHAREVAMVKTLLKRLTEHFLVPLDIGIITMSPAQAILLSQELDERWEDVQIGTLDTFKGQEKTIIIVCCLNEEIRDGKVSDAQFIQAMSRARQATIVIGNVECLKAAKSWSTMVEYAEGRGCVKEGCHINVRIQPGDLRNPRPNQGQERRQGPAVGPGPGRVLFYPGPVLGPALGLAPRQPPAYHPAPGPILNPLLQFQVPPGPDGPPTPSSSSSGVNHGQQQPASSGSSVQWGSTPAGTSFSFRAQKKLCFKLNGPQDPAPAMPNPNPPPEPNEQIAAVPNGFFMMQLVPNVSGQGWVMSNAYMAPPDNEVANPVHPIAQHR